MLEVVPQQTCVAAVGGGGEGGVVTHGESWEVHVQMSALHFEVGMLIGQTSAHIISMQL